MCDSCTGDPTKFQELLSPEQQALRKKMISGTTNGFPGISSMLDVGATPYGGPLSAGIDPMSLMAANVMMGIGTGGQRGYTAPNFYGMGGSANPWSGQDSGGGGGNNNGFGTWTGPITPENLQQPPPGTPPNPWGRQPTPIPGNPLPYRLPVRTLPMKSPWDY